MATPKTVLPDLGLARIRRRCDHLALSPHVDPLLAEIEAGPTSIF